MAPDLRPIRALAAFCLLLALLAGGPARAARVPAEPLPDALLCLDRIARIERAEGLPAGLLQAVALAESGRYDPDRGTVLPWPWTVNAGGEGIYLPSKAEAIRHVERLRAQGRTNIDVGCLQINLGWHANAFPDLDSAFDPETNAAYAAAFLATLREEAGSWELAVERYHSRDPDRGLAYRERVWRHWAALGGELSPRVDPPGRSAAPAVSTTARLARTPPPARPLAVTPLRDAAIERAALQAVNRLAARQTWRWLQLGSTLPGAPLPRPPAEILAALDPASAEPAAGAVVPTALLPRPRVFAGPGRPVVLAGPGRIPGLIPVRPARPEPAPTPSSSRPPARPRPGRGVRRDVRWGAEADPSRSTSRRRVTSEAVRGPEGRTGQRARRAPSLARRDEPLGPRIAHLESWPGPSRPRDTCLERRAVQAYVEVMAKIANEQGHLTGMLLIAMPGMPDPRFAKTVIYLCAHSPQGAMGLVVNQIAQGVSLPKVVEQLGIRPEIDLSGEKVHVGGPVETGRGFVLHSCDYVQENTLVIDDRFALTATVDVLKAIAEGSGPRRKVFALGYSGWAPGQLDAEIQANGWLVAPADEELVFGGDDESKWQRALARLGVDPVALSSAAGRA
ncbi:MAG: hypothetical protein KatS3mg117_1907 [Geminicoccaceae bacterium]|nr:MAG: hypothetical protein KatS3mg117_1907 [Geminicoccaceae bacterium]